jgi:diaminohydroxyphosphoribosylaminopyrimidine deaminase / 5-amino-6-(5-phosphoribosylamino)uracil reductase
VSDDGLGSPDDIRFMQRALTLARYGWGQTAPNPMVGAVVVREGRITGEGFHTRFGAPHAEIEALARAGDSARGATLYVTLEPCTHEGKTPPCVPEIIQAGISRVVIAALDPTPLAGGGAGLLRAAGIQVTIGCEEDDAVELNAPFFFSTRSDRPWVTVKVAVSLDGALADSRRSRGWISNAASHRRVHEMRAGVDAVAVGAQTVLDDDPALTVRDAPVPRITPLRVVFDRRGRIGPSARLVGTARTTPTLVYVSSKAHQNAVDLEKAGVTVAEAPDLRSALRDLKERRVISLLVEGGAAVLGSFFEQMFVDRLVIFQAPVLLGAGALPAFGGVPPQTVGAARRFRVIERADLDGDTMTVYEVTRL